MRKLTLTLSLAAAAAVVAPLGSAEAQWDVLRRRTESGTVIRGDTRDSRGVYGDVVYDRNGNATRVPPGHMPPRGMCRVWIDGVPPGRQPRATDCSTAQREAYRYGSRARVIYGGDSYGRNDRRSTRTYEQVINGRRCRITERADGTRRTVCDDRYDSRSTRSNGTWGSNRVYESNGRWDDDSDRRVKTKVKTVKVKQKGNGKGKGNKH